MARGADQNDAVSLTVNPCNSRHAPVLPTLPIEIVEKIICRFPVKFLSQLRCVCKSWNFLISDPKFARRHLRRFNRRILLVVAHDPIQFMSYPLGSLLKTVITGATQLGNPLKYCGRDYSIMGSCDGIICCHCGVGPDDSFIVWNPSIRKIWELTPLHRSQLEVHSWRSCGFGYDHLSNSFKLIVIFRATGVMVHTLGSNSWRRIGDFPCVLPDWRASGILVSCALNWLTLDGNLNITKNIISFDLGKETYQEFLQPNHGCKDGTLLVLDVMRDCLCILANLETLLNYKQNLSSYSYKNGTIRIFDLENKPERIHDMYLETESLISPYPQN